MQYGKNLLLLIFACTMLFGAERPPQPPKRLPTFMEMVERVSETQKQEQEHLQERENILKSNNIPKLKADIIARYKPSAGNCGAGITVAKRDRKGGQDIAAHHIACLIKGERNIILISSEMLKSELKNDPQMYDIFIKVAKAENIKELDGYLFRPEGERNALLLIKASLKGVRGDYFLGYLLGYKLEDIKFYFQRTGFIHIAQKLGKPLPSSYADFSPELKEEFEKYKKNIWTPERCQRDEQEKNRVLQWIEENKKFSNEQLYQQIQELKKGIKQ